MQTEKRREFIINSFYYILILSIIVLACKFVLPAILPFILAFIISTILNKPINYINKKIKINRKLTSIFIVSIFYLTIGFFITIISSESFSVISKIITEIPTLYNKHIVPVLNDLILKFETETNQLGNFSIDFNSIGKEMISSIGTALSNLSVSIITKISNIAISLPGLLVKTIILIISTFFITIDYHKIINFCKHQINNKTSDLILEIKNYIFGTLWVCIRSYLLIMGITFLELSIGLTIIGIKNSIIIALCISIFDILPVLGTGGIMIPWTIISAILGNYNTAIGLAIIYIIVTAIRNIIEPKIVGSQLGLHPIATLSSMFLGVGLIGGIGLFGFPILLSLLVYLNKKGTINILKIPQEDIENEQKTKKIK